jgi:hypothetical protein
MSSIHRAGLLIAGFVTAVAVAGMFTVQGYMAARQAQAAQPVAPVVADVFNEPADSPSPSPSDTLPPQIIYIAPPTPTPAPATPAPAVVPPAPAVQATPPIIHVVVTAPPGEHEGPGDDD